MKCFCDNYVSYQRNTVRKSRRERRCDECHGLIEQGESYLDSVFINDGSWDKQAICQYCKEDIEILEDLGYCVSVGDGSVSELWDFVMRS